MTGRENISKEKSVPQHPNVSIGICGLYSTGIESLMSDPAHYCLNSLLMWGGLATATGRPDDIDISLEHSDYRLSFTWRSSLAHWPANVYGSPAWASHGPVFDQRSGVICWHRPWELGDRSSPYGCSRIRVLSHLSSKTDG